MYIDTHSHVYSEEFSKDRSEIFRRARLAHVEKILMPAIDSSTHEAMLTLEKANEDVCISMMGLHPCSIKEDYEEELKIVKKNFDQRRFTAVGEIGLDFYWDIQFKAQQYDAFGQQINLALQYDVPIVIHSRNSTEECIEIVSGYVKSGLRGVFHCFGGKVEEAKKIIQMGFYLGIGGVVTFKKSGLDAVINEVGLDMVILETDAPYLAPTPYRGKRNEPSYIPIIAQKLAEIIGVSLEQVAEITSSNAVNLFAL